MTKVYIGYDQYGIEGVNNEFIEFVFDVVAGMAKLHPDAEVGVVVTDDDQMQQLNRQYRGKDYPTNVLSFGYTETAKGDGMPVDDKHYLGDIYMSRRLVTDEAKEMKISSRARFAHLFVHGLLHLAGMHHDTQAQAEKMEELEDTILAKIGESQ